MAAGAPAVEASDARQRLADRLVTFRGEDPDGEARAILASIVEATA